MNLLEALILASEKAANITRLCRYDENLFPLLIQRKATSDANPRFVDDFKTLADVLIQESVKYEVQKYLPDLSNCIYGEETNVFTNKLGVSITVEIKESFDSTSKLLQIVLNDNEAAAQLLAMEVHKELDINDLYTNGICSEVAVKEFEFPQENLGIWIDPIDATLEYIDGEQTFLSNGIYQKGLQCVTILIGVFDQKSGRPLMGVINQPFASIDLDDLKSAKSKCFWGISTPNFQLSSVPKQMYRTTNTVLISGSETTEIQEILRENGYKIIPVSGAGYKLLCVINGVADIFLLTKDSTFKWDTCGPHAILKSLNGDIINYTEALASPEHFTPISYQLNKEQSTLNNCNCGGIIAYKRFEDVQRLVNILRTL